MTYRLAATLTAIIYVILFPILLLVPDSYMATYGVTSTDAAAFMSRRSAPVLLAFAAVLWLARDAEPSPARRAICAGVIVCFAGIALTGIYEFATGLAAWPILIAAAGELLVAAVFASFLRD